MIIQKKIQDAVIKLKLTKIKTYPRYDIYQISKLINNKEIKLYKECFFNLDIINFTKKGFKVGSEL